MKRILVYVYLPLTLAYLSLSVAFPLDSVTTASRHLSMTQARMIALGVALPRVVVWFLALYGAQRFREYSRSIKKYRDGAIFVKLSTGVMGLALLLPVRAVAKDVFNAISSSHPVFSTVDDAIITYVVLAWLLASFVLISKAARELIIITKAKVAPRSNYVLSLLFIGLGVLYCYASFAIDDEISPTNWLVTNQHDIYLPLRIVTVMVPYLFLWFIGLQAAYDIYTYRRLVRGVIYVRAFKLLAIGLMTMLAVTILTQLATLTAGTLQSLSLEGLLAVAYLLIALTGVGFIMITKGVSNLQELEKV